MTEKGVVTATTDNPVKRLSHRHKRVLDFMVRNPEMKMGEIADALKYTPAWISTIVNSDLFQAEYRRRREAFEVQDNRALVNKLNKAAHMGLDKLLDHIEYDIDADEEFDMLEGPSFQEVKQVTELALKASGYLNGGGQGQGTTVNIQNNQVNETPQVAASTLETARARIINGQAADIDAEEPAVKALQTRKES